MKNSIDIDNIIARYFSGEEITHSQKDELMKWAAINPDEFNKLKKIMISTNFESNSDLIFDKDKAWAKIEPHLNTPVQRNFKRIALYFAYAASLLLIVGMTWFWPAKQAVSMTYANTENVLKNIILPDSSMVTLYPNSNIKYEAQAKEGNRGLKLIGKAFFKVKKDGRPFIVEAYNVKIMVLGTSFLVTSNSNNNAAVYVKTGLVSVENGKNKVLLRANQQAIVADNKIATSTISDPEVMFGNTSQSLVLNNCPISQAVSKIEKKFNVKIDIDDKLKGNRVTTKLKDDNLSSILKELSYICNCKCDTLSENHYKLYFP